KVRTLREGTAMKPHTGCLSLLVLSVCFAAQVCSASSVTLPGSELRMMKSPSTGRDYDLYIHKPADFDKSTDKKYPVLYLLDGQWDFKLLDSGIGGLVDGKG